MDEVSHNRAQQKKTENGKKQPSGKKQSGVQNSAGGITMTAVERAIESLAALVSKSYVKEEIVHGSFRYSM